MAVWLPGGLSMGRDLSPEISIVASAEGVPGLRISLCFLELLFVNFSVVNVDMGFMRRRHFRDGKIQSF